MGFTDWVSKRSASAPQKPKSRSSKKPQPFTDESFQRTIKEEIYGTCAKSSAPLIDLIKNQQGRGGDYSLDYRFQILLETIPDLIQTDRKVQQSISAFDKDGNNVVHLLLEKLVYCKPFIKDNKPEVDAEIIVGIQNCLLIFIESHPGLLKQKNIAGLFPLHIAASVGEFLLTHTLDILQKRDYKDFFDFLLHKGADLHATDPDGNTAIHVAAYFGQANTTMWLKDYLMERKVNVNPPNRHGDTPIHLVSLGPRDTHIPSFSDYVKTSYYLVRAVLFQKKMYDFSTDKILRAIDVANKDGYFPGANILDLLAKKYSAFHEFATTDQQKYIVNHGSITKALLFSAVYGARYRSLNHHLNPVVLSASLFYYDINYVGIYENDKQKAFLHLIEHHTFLRDLLETLPKLMQDSDIAPLIHNSKLHLEKALNILSPQGSSILHVLMNRLKTDAAVLINHIKVQHKNRSHKAQIYMGILQNLLKLTEINIEYIMDRQLPVSKIRNRQNEISLLMIENSQRITPLDQISALIQQLIPFLGKERFQFFKRLITDYGTLARKEYKNPNLDNSYSRYDGIYKPPSSGQWFS